MKFPPFLKKGDKIGIISSARKISPDEAACCVSILENQGYRVALGQHLFAEEHQFAGTDAQRLSDIQSFLDNSEIKALIFARGGYGTVRIVDHIEFSCFTQHPKWIVGYSDITVLHAHIHQNYDIATVHATMPINFPNEGTINKTIQSLLDVLSGKQITYSFSAHPLNITGEMHGTMVGGNLSILYSLTGTASQLDTKNKILFIEDLDEYLYHIDRMMMNLKRSGMLNNLKGLVVGGMTQMHDNTVAFGKTAEEIIFDCVKEYGYPLCFNFPAGHIDENYAFINGGTVNIQVETTQKSTFKSI